MAAACTLSLPTLAFASTTHSGQSANTVKTHSTPQYVTVQGGDTLYGLALKYHTTVKSLAQWNHIRSTQILHIGQRLIVGWNTSGGTKAASSWTLSSRSGSVNSSLSTVALGEAIAKYATQFQGVPYSWGGTSPKGFDCSGLVQFTFSRFGIQLPRTSYSQFEQGRPVPVGNLLPGDLIFSNTNGPGASHVGIYIGNGQFIQAGGRSVSIQNVNSSYWRLHFVGARRIIGS